MIIDLAEVHNVGCRKEKLAQNLRVSANNEKFEVLLEPLEKV